MVINDLNIEDIKADGVVEITIARSSGKTEEIINNKSQQDMQ